MEVFCKKALAGIASAGGAYISVSISIRSLIIQELQGTLGANRAAGAVTPSACGGGTGITENFTPSHHFKFSDFKTSNLVFTF